MSLSREILCILGAQQLYATVVGFFAVLCKCGFRWLPFKVLGDGWGILAVWLNSG